MQGVLKLKHKAMAEDVRPVDPTCKCMVCVIRGYPMILLLIFSAIFLILICLYLFLQVCKNYTRAYIHCLVTKDAMGSQLLSYHNLYYMMKVKTYRNYYKFNPWGLNLPSNLKLNISNSQLSRDLHSSIVQGQFPQYVCISFYWL